MYQNMTREEMIQRLYDGNFTTGELERQLIAKLFEQCCGGGSGGSSGSGSFVTNVVAEEGGAVHLDKTAGEIWEASQTGPVFARDTLTLQQEGATMEIVATLPIIISKNNTTYFVYYNRLNLEGGEELTESTVLKAEGASKHPRTLGTVDPDSEPGDDGPSV